MNVRTIVAAGAVLATLGAATAPAAGLAAGAPTKTLTYTVSVKKGKLVNGQTSVRARVVVTSPQNDVQDWWSRAAVSAVVRKGVNGGYEQPYASQGYRCVPVVTGTTARFTCKLQGADVPTTVKLTYTAPFKPPTA